MSTRRSHELAEDRAQQTAPHAPQAEKPVTQPARENPPRPALEAPAPAPKTDPNSDGEAESDSADLDRIAATSTGVDEAKYAAYAVHGVSDPDTDDDDDDDDEEDGVSAYTTLGTGSPDPHTNRRQPLRVRLAPSAQHSALVKQTAAAAHRRPEENQWNAMYQHALSLPDSEPGKATLLYSIYCEFSSAVRRTARLIVSELSLPASKRTIQPDSSLGGVAGGIKFLHQGVLYKIPLDPVVDPKTQRRLYSGSPTPSWELASKAAAGHDLKGANTMFEAATATGTDVRVPLQVIVDFRGFRVLAMPILPLPAGSRQYGSNDGGATVHAEDNAINDGMRVMGEHIHLAAHQVGAGDARRTMFSAGDVEVHRGSDSLAYALDFGRVMPPEAPDQTPHLPRVRSSVFTRLLRPELLRRWRDEKQGAPLNPDGFTKWNLHEPCKDKHHDDLRAGTRFLLDEVVPAFANELCAEMEGSGAGVAEWLSGRRLIDAAHARGINARHLGLVRSHVEAESGGSNAAASELLLLECTKRTLKCMLRRQLRLLLLSGDDADPVDAPPDDEDDIVDEELLDQLLERATMATTSQQSEVARTAARFVHLILSTPGGSTFYDQDVVPGVRARFGAEATAGADASAVAASVHRHSLVVVHYVLASVGVRLSSAFLSDLQRLASAQGESVSAVLVRTRPSSIDVEEGEARVKDMQVLTVAEGRALLAEAAGLEADKGAGGGGGGGGHGDSSAPAVRLVDMALQRLSSGAAEHVKATLLPSDVENLKCAITQMASQNEATHAAALHWLEHEAVKPHGDVAWKTLGVLSEWWRAKPPGSGLGGEPGATRRFASALKRLSELEREEEALDEECRRTRDELAALIKPLALSCKSLGRDLREVVSACDLRKALAVEEAELVAAQATLARFECEATLEVSQMVLHPAEVGARIEALLTPEQTVSLALECSSVGESQLRLELCHADAGAAVPGPTAIHGAASRGDLDHAVQLVRLGCRVEDAPTDRQAVLRFVAGGVDAIPAVEQWTAWDWKRGGNAQLAANALKAGDGVLPEQLLDGDPRGDQEVEMAALRCALRGVDDFEGEVEVHSPLLWPVVLAAHLESSSRVTRVDVSGCGISDPALLVKFLRAHPEVGKVELAGNQLDTNAGPLLELWRDGLSLSCDLSAVREMLDKEEFSSAKVKRAVLSLVDPEQNVFELDLDKSGVTDCDLVLLADALKVNQTLTVLKLYNNPIAIVAPLAEALRVNQTLTELDLGYNQISDVAPLGEALRVNKTLTKLYIYATQISDVAPLGEALRENSTLTWLNLRSNQIADVAPLGEGLRENQTLTQLYLECNPISEGQAAIRAAWGGRSYYLEL